MARAFASEFYNSTAWKTCRERYKRRVGYLCEDCLDKGIHTMGDIVHHIIEITPENIDDPGVTLNFDNLRYVCRDCHAERHKESNKGRRYVYGPDGEVIVNGEA